MSNEPRRADRPPLSYASKQACRRVIHEAGERVRARHASISGEEDEMRDDIEAMMRETEKLGDLDTHKRLGEAIDDLAEKRMRRFRAAEIIDDALARFWRPRLM